MEQKIAGYLVSPNGEREPLYELPEVPHIEGETKFEYQERVRIMWEQWIWGEEAE